MKSIYIVIGATGEGDEQRSWLVKAFPNEAEALKFIDKLESTYEQSEGESEVEGTDDSDVHENPHFLEAMKALDENFECDPTTGTEYSVIGCPYEDGAASSRKIPGEKARFPRSSSLERSKKPAPKRARRS